MKRRSALQLGGLVLLATVSGCSVPQVTTSQGIVVSKITLRNRLERDVQASVLLTDGDEIVLWRTVTVSTAPNQFVTFDESLAKSGYYTLYAQIPHTEESESVQVDLVEDAGDQSCIEVTLEIVTAEQDGTENPTIIYGSLGRCDSQS
jgi:hypothetical protein